MELRLVSIEEVIAAQKIQNQKDFNSLSTGDLMMIKNNFSLENDGRLLNCYRFQALPKSPLYKFVKSLQQREIAFYCKELGWTISNDLIIKAVK